MLSTLLWGTVLGYTIFAGGVVVVKVLVDKQTNEYNKIWRDKLDEEMKEHWAKTDEVLVKYDEQIKENVTVEETIALTDDEVLQLDDLFRRAKKDGRFKDKLEGIRLTDIFYEALEINCKRTRESMDGVCKIIEKW